MHLSVLLTILAGFSSFVCGAEEYRFHRSQGVIGLMNDVMDSKGVATSIQFDNASDAAAMEVWGALIDADINGTFGPGNYNGLFFDQPIIFTGEFTSGVRHTRAVENGAGSEPYRVFKVTGIRIGFPFSHLRHQRGFLDPLRTVLETHFGFESLFPKGIKLDGKKIDLSRFRDPPQDRLSIIPSSDPIGEQGGAGQPATRSQSKSEGSQKPQPESEGLSR